MITRLKFGLRQTGATSEYGVLAALVIVIAIASVQAVGIKANESMFLFDRAQTEDGDNTETPNTPGEPGSSSSTGTGTAKPPISGGIDCGDIDGNNRCQNTDDGSNSSAANNAGQTSSPTTNYI